MKKTYISAEIKVENPVAVTSIICQSTRTYKPAGVWGKGSEEGGLYPNEGYTMRPTAIGDQEGGFDSQTKGRGDDWGSIW